MASSEDSGYVLQNEVVCIETKSVEPVLCKPRLLPLKSVKLSGYEVEDEIKGAENLGFNNHKPK
ncbi:unnamed protein product [Schistosoma rodhaini]|uniref:Ovule protein n=1 Tax=Schistosoma mansoni TaxID=6183 RepID=A0A5K4F8L7_SCHMA|nr:unnamed protein product [Schistosoma rodhaini]